MVAFCAKCRLDSALLALHSSIQKNSSLLWQGSLGLRSRRGQQCMVSKLQLGHGNVHPATLCIVAFVLKSAPLCCHQMTQHRDYLCGFSWSVIIVLLRALVLNLSFTDFVCEDQSKVS